jgi:hypothetical protein
MSKSSEQLNVLPGGTSEAAALAREDSAERGPGAASVTAVGRWRVLRRPSPPLPSEPGTEGQLVYDSAERQKGGSDQ